MRQIIKINRFLDKIVKKGIAMIYLAVKLESDLHISYNVDLCYDLSSTSLILGGQILP